MRTFLGVDQSLARTGIVVLDEEGDMILRRLVTPGELRDAARLAFIRNLIAAAIEETKPVAAAYEGYSFESPHRAFALGELGGIVQVALFDAELPYRVIAPKTLKRFVAGHGDADKEKMLRKTKDKWKIDFGDEDDLCDAHGLARLMLAMDDPKKLKFRHELEVVHELLTPPKKDAPLKPAKGKITISV
jgi:Holliday junction resolvasome RuvABC endonuclease subunit